MLNKLVYITLSRDDIIKIIISWISIVTPVSIKGR